MSEIINKESEQIKVFISAINSILDSIDNMSNDYRPFLDGERFMTDSEVSKVLHISRRTLQDYRTQGKIPYYQFGGKILYKESNIEQILQDGYRESFD